MRENFHAATAFSFLMQPEHNFLCNWVEEDVIELEDTIVRLVLATDMKRHFEHIKTLKTAGPGGDPGGDPRPLTPHTFQLTP